MQQTFTVTQTNEEISSGESQREQKKERKTELLYDGNFYDITSWVSKHPGGKIIEMFASTGEDAIHAVQQFHFRSTERVMNIMKSLPKRQAKDNELGQNASEKNKSLTVDFLKLFDELKSEGYFEPAPWHVASRFLDVFLLLVIGNWIYFSSESLWAAAIGICVTALGYGRSAMLGHECGHHSLTGNPNADRNILSLLFGLSIGGSGSYWINQHSRHHAMVQHLHNDIDVKTLPLIAFNKKVVKDPKDGKTFFIQNQKWLFVFDTLLVTTAWKFYLHPEYVLRKGKYFELFIMLIHLVGVYSLYGFVAVTLTQWLGSLFLLGNFTLNHSHLPVTEVSTHWVEQTLVHTANIRSSYFGWTDYWMGNLNYQIEHHLFPTMPQYRNKLIRDRVKALAKKHNLPYNLMSYSEAVAKSFNNLGEVSRELM